MLAKTKVFAISNDPSLTGLLEEEFGSGDFEMASTNHTGDSLKALIIAEDPDILIVDVMMPNLDGIGLCLTMRQWTQLPIVMLSKWDTPEGKVRGLDLGSESYLTEPFGAKELKSRINETIKRNATMSDTMVNTGNGTYN